MNPSSALAIIQVIKIAADTLAASQQGNLSPEDEAAAWEEIAAKATDAKSFWEESKRLAAARREAGEE